MKRGGGPSWTGRTPVRTAGRSSAGWEPASTGTWPATAGPRMPRKSEEDGVTFVRLVHSKTEHGLASALRSPSSLTTAPDPVARSTMEPALDKQDSLCHIRIALLGAASFPTPASAQGRGQAGGPPSAPRAQDSACTDADTRACCGLSTSPATQPCRCRARLAAAGGPRRPHAREDRGAAAAAAAGQGGRQAGGSGAGGWGAPGASGGTALPHPPTADSGQRSREQSAKGPRCKGGAASPLRF